jgi:hypothetical protein
MVRLAMIVLWSSFLAAIVAEGCFFSVFDPHELLLAGRQIELSPLAAYTIGFFIFWIFCSLASMLTCYLIGMPDDRMRASK